MDNIAEFGDKLRDSREQKQVSSRQQHRQAKILKENPKIKGFRRNKGGSKKDEKKKSAGEGRAAE